MSVSSWIRRQFKNGVSIVDTIPTGLSNSASSFTAADGTTFPDGSVGPFIVTVDQGLATEEKILIQSRSGAVFTIAANGRGYNGGSAQTHGTNATIFHTLDAQDLDEANQVVVQTLGAITASGDLLVGTAANTLTKIPVGAAHTFLTSTGTSLTYIGFGSGGTTAIASAGADGTSNNPARYDHTHAGVTSFNGSGGAVTGVASFNGQTGAISQTNGYGITGANLGPPVPAVSLTSAAGHLTSDYTVTGSLATFLSTASLAVGTWLVSFNGIVQILSSSTAVEIEALVGTATATFDGASSTEVFPTSTAVIPAGFSFIATVTVAGTLSFQAVGNTSNKINASTPTSTLVHATGYTAVRIA